MIASSSFMLLMFSLTFASGLQPIAIVYNQGFQGPIAVVSPQLREFVRDVSDFNMPLDIELAIHRYVNTSYGKSLEASWQHATEAKSIASILIGEAEKCVSFLNNPAPTGLFTYGPDAISNAMACTYVQTNYTQAVGYYENAIQASYNLVEDIRRLLIQDLTKLEEIGADNPAYNGYAAAKYGQALLLLQRFHFENYTNTQYECNEDIEAMTICVMQRIKTETENVSFAVQTFNMITEGEHSFFKNHLNFHHEIEEAIAEMYYEYDESKILFDEKNVYLDEILGWLYNQQVELVTQDVIDYVNSRGSAQVKLVPLETGPLDVQSSKIKLKLSELKRKKLASMAIFNSKRHDFLFLAIEKLEETNTELQDITDIAEALKEDLYSLARTAEKTYEELRDELSEEALLSTFLEIALDYAEKAADEKTFGRKIKLYADAIKCLLSSENSGINLDKDLSIIEKIIQNLEKNNIDVSDEKRTHAYLEEISKKNNEALFPITHATAQTLTEKLKMKSTSLVDQILDLRLEASNYLCDATLFLEDSNLSSHLDESKIREYRENFELSLEQDVLLNADEIKTLYTEIVNYLKPKLSFLKSIYVSDSTQEKQEPQIIFNEISQNNETTKVSLTPIYLNETTAALNPTLNSDLIQLSNQISLICMFEQCSSLELKYDKLISDINNGKDSDLLPLKENINEESIQILETFSDSSDLDLINHLLKNFSRSVDTNVDINFNSSFVVFSEKDYLESNKQFEQLKSIHETLLSELFVSKQPIDRLKELTEKYSLSDLKSYVSNLNNLRQNLNSSILLLATQAKTGLQNAKESFINSTNRDHLYLSLTKATDSLKDGYSNRALIYSHYVIGASILSEPFYFPYEYLIIFVVIGGFLAYMLLKPKKPKEIKKRKLRQLPS